jgi:processing peptidase subunit beta
VWIDTGSRFDQKAGVAHFLEHLFFKGTAKRTRVQLETEIEDIGGHLNAYTSREHTVFFAKVFKKDVPQAMDILADILQNSTFNQDAVVRERDTILRESSEVDKNMEEVIYDKLHYTAYRGSSLGQTILGPEDNIKTMTAEDIKTYVDTHYTGPRMVICGAGAITHDQLHGLGEKLFTNIPSSPRNGARVIQPPTEFIGSDYRQREDGSTVAHIALGFETCGHTDPDTVGLWILQGLLGSWNKTASTNGVFSSSRLVSAVASNQYANSISTFNTQYADTGLFGVYAVSEAVGLSDLMWSITGNITRLAYNVEPELLEEVKRQTWQSMLSQLDGSTPICEDIGRQVLSYGRRMQPAEIYNRIMSVDANGLRAVAKRFFYDRDHALAAIGPIWELPDYNWIRRRSYYLRF